MASSRGHRRRILSWAHYLLDRYGELCTYLGENFCLLNDFGYSWSAFRSEAEHSQRRFFHDSLALVQCVRQALVYGTDDWLCLLRRPQ